MDDEDIKLPQLAALPAVEIPPVAVEHRPRPGRGRGAPAVRPGVLLFALLTALVVGVAIGMAVAGAPSTLVTIAANVLAFVVVGIAVTRR